MKAKSVQTKGKSSMSKGSSKSPAKPKGTLVEAKKPSATVKDVRAAGAKPASTAKAPLAGAKVAKPAPLASKKPAPSKSVPKGKEDLDPRGLALAAGAELSESEREEMEEQAEVSAASAASSSAGGESAAIAAASGQQEMSHSFKNFRHHPDMENFYRFIHDNDLRLEALTIIDEVLDQKRQKRMAKQQKTQAH